MATFSQIKIQFLVPFTAGFQLVLVRLNSGGTTTNTFNFVVLRLSPFQVTVGATPTAAETATNFRTAFDLDFPTGFTTSVSDDEVTIQSETEGEDFIAFNALNASGTLLVPETDFNVEFSNFTPTIDTSNIDLALVRSPHYVNTPFSLSTTKSVEIDVTIWDGDLTSPPATPTYTLTRIRPTVDFTDLQTNLSPLIKSALDPKPVVSLNGQLLQQLNSDNNSVKWIEYVASYTDPTTNIADVTGLFSAVDGYGYHSEGVNPTRTENRILLSNITRRRAARNGIVLVPFVNDGTYENYNITISPSDSILIVTTPIVTSELSNEFIKYILIDVSLLTNATTMDLVFTPKPKDIINNVFFDIIDECKYDAKTIIFKNKFGVFETLPFFKRAVNSIEIKKEEFVNKFVSGGTYDTTKHQYRNINYEAREKLTLNSGYVTEIENESYKQLLLSDQVWLYDPDGIIPLNIETSNLELKDIKNDKLFQYTIDFKYSFDAIQNI
jgi:hypothetical protein